jgi:hypothetical protein
LNRSCRPECLNSTSNSITWLKRFVVEREHEFANWTIALQVHDDLAQGASTSRACEPIGFVTECEQFVAVFAHRLFLSQVAAAVAAVVVDPLLCPLDPTLICLRPIDAVTEVVKEEIQIAARDPDAGFKQPLLHEDGRGSLDCPAIVFDRAFHDRLEPSHNQLCAFPRGNETLDRLRSRG